MKISNWIRQKGYGFFLSCSIPIVIMVVIYMNLEIYPGSDRLVIASDALAQGAPFLASFNNALHGKQSFLYSWNASLGVNYWSLMAYYLNSIFSPLVYFFDNSQVPDAMYFIILLKFGAMGGTFWVMSDQLFKIPQWIKVLLSSSYALNGFAVAYSPQQMWLDGLIYLPLVFLGIHRILDRKGSIVLFCSYLLLFLSNFYMAFMIGVFSFLYFFCVFFTNPMRFKSCWKPYLITSFLAGGASMITILPTIIDLKNNGESLTPITSFFTKGTGIWDLSVKTMVGVYDTSKYNSAPFFYFSLLGLIFCIFYFVSSKIPKRNKYLYGGLFVLLVASVYVDPLNLFWHGFHAPYMFLFRFSFLFAFFGLFLSGFAIEVVEKKDINKFANIILILIALYIFSVFLADRKRYDYLDRSSLIFTVVLLVIYLILGVSKQKWPKQSIIWKSLCICFVLAELTINTFFMVQGINEEWRYPDRKSYSENYKDINQLVLQTKEENKGFYRLANIDSRSRNESFVYGYSGVSLFSSIRNRHSSAYLNNLGFRSEGTNLTIQYENNTLIMDALLGMKYNLGKDDVNKYGFTKKATVGKYSLYENKFALPLGILTDKGIYEKDEVQNQTELLQYLSGTTESFFYFSEVQLTNSKNVEISEKDNQVFYSAVSPNKLRKVTYSIDVPAKTQAYLSLYGNTADTDIVMKVNGVEHQTGLVSTGQYYNLGYYEQATTIEAELTLTGDDVARIVQPNAMFLDVDRFESALKAVEKKGVTFQTTGRSAEAKINLEKDQVVWTTIPYDKGWSAYIDGKKTSIPTFKDAFLALPVPKGAHTIRFNFVPQGFKLGVELFISCSLLFIVYNKWDRKNIKRKEQKNEEKNL